jgi:hypothetical protein
MRLELVLAAVAFAAACAGPEPEVVAPQPVAVVVPTPPVLPPAPSETIAEFACEGEILHQSLERGSSSPIAFWLWIDGDLAVRGWLADIGPPLSLPGAELSGRMRVEYNDSGRLTGGEVSLDWPFVRDGPPLLLTMMRETHMKLGPRFTRLTGDQTYLSAKLRFATDSHPRLAALKHVAVITATCIPDPDLPPGPGAS